MYCHHCKVLPIDAGKRKYCRYCTKHTVYNAKRRGKVVEVVDHGDLSEFDDLHLAVLESIMDCLRAKQPLCC